MAASIPHLRRQDVRRTYQSQKTRYAKQNVMVQSLSGMIELNIPTMVKLFFQPKDNLETSKLSTHENLMLIIMYLLFIRSGV
jgi:hypothetical protein